MEAAFFDGFIDELEKLGGPKPPVKPKPPATPKAPLPNPAATAAPWYSGIPGAGGAKFFMRSAPYLAAFGLPLALAGYGLGRGLRTPAGTPQPWEERY